MKFDRPYILILRAGSWDELDIHCLDIHQAHSAALAEMADGEEAVLYSCKTNIYYRLVRRGDRIKPYLPKGTYGKKTKGVQSKSVSKKRNT